MNAAPNPLTPLEHELLAGRRVVLPDVEPALLERYRGLLALGTHQDLAAVDCLRRSRDGFVAGSLERAISERLYGLALIRVQREVEGTFALERADPVLERHGCALFELD